MIDRYNTKNPILGTLYLTATHLIFVEPDTNKETWVSWKYVSYLHTLNDSITKVARNLLKFKFFENNDSIIDFFKSRKHKIGKAVL